MQKICFAATETWEILIIFIIIIFTNYYIKEAQITNISKQNLVDIHHDFK